MTPLMTLLAAVGIVLVASTLTVFAIYHPLRRQLATLCPVDATAEFWMRSVVALIYLLPIFVVLTFGLPRLTADAFTVAEVVRRTVAATAFTLAAVVSGIALRLASLRPGHRLDYPPVR